MNYFTEQARFTQTSYQFPFVWDEECHIFYAFKVPNRIANH